MSNGLYKAGRTAFAMGNIKWRSTGGDAIRCLLVTRAYTPRLDKDKTLSDIPVRARIGKNGDTSVDQFPRLVMVTPEDGVCDANSVDFGQVPTNNEIKGVVIFKDSSEEKSSTLIAYVGTDFITNGTQVIIDWDSGPGKIFRL